MSYLKETAIGRKEYESLSEEEKLTFWEKLPFANKAEDEELDPGLEKFLKRDEAKVEKGVALPPLELPEVRYRLYRVWDEYYASFDELLTYVFQFGEDVKVTTLELLGDFLGKKDVLREVMPDGTVLLLSAVDEDGFGIYNHERSLREGSAIWEFSHGDIKDLYKPFKDRGIKLDVDVYGKIEEEDKKLLAKVREEGYFNSGS